MDSPEVIKMGLGPLDPRQWIETDRELPRYHQHKLEQRKNLGSRVFQTTASSHLAERELSDMLANHLLSEQREHYRVEDGQMMCSNGGFKTPLESPEPLWNCSLWVADDLVLMQEKNGEYCMSAASLCSASEWTLESKIGHPIAEIHQPVPGLNLTIGPMINRFFVRLQPNKPVVRFIWSLQVGGELNQRPEMVKAVKHDSEIFYRCERQTLQRLPKTGALAFTIRTYLHPLEALGEIPHALPRLFDLIDALPRELADYKRMPELSPALKRYRELATTQSSAE